ncbi:MAG: UbiA family prenyltransferase [Promethearchaeota archaeon]
MRIVLLLKMSRPVSWLFAPLVFLLGFACYRGVLTPVSLFQLVMLSVPYCMFLYGINDIYDFASDQINPRKQHLVGIRLEPSHHSLVKKVAIVVGVILLASSLITLNLMNIFGMGLLLFFSYQYSAPPLRLKERPPLDSISNGVIYYLAPIVIGVSYGTIPFNAPVQLYLITIAVMGIHSFSTVTDYSADKEVGDKTFAVVFGKRAAALFSLVVFAISYFFAGYQGTVINWYLLLLMIFSVIIIVYPSERLATVLFYTIGAAFIVVAALLIQMWFNFWS